MWKRRPIQGLCVGLLCVSSAALSSGAQRTLPKAKSAAPVKTMIGLSGYSESWSNRIGANPSSDVVRVGQEVSRFEGWLSPRDPAIALMKKSPKLAARVKADILFGADGRATGCSIMSIEGDDILANSLCGRLLAGARLVPPMDPQGQRHDDTFRLEVTFNLDHFKYRSLGRDEPRLVDSAGPKLVPVPPMPPAGSFVPWEQKSAVTVANVPVFSPGPNDIPDNATVTPITVSVGPDGKATCRIAKFRFEVVADDAACDAVANGQFSAPAGASETARMLSLLVVRLSGQTAVLLQRNARNEYVKAKNGTWQGLEARLSSLRDGASLREAVIQLSIRPDGSASDCWVNDTTGSDRGDLLVCSDLRKESFSPEEDIFGRRVKGAFMAIRPLSKDNE